MKVPRDRSGSDLVKVLCRDWDYRIVHQEGSHIILQTQTPGHQRLAVPNNSRLVQVQTVWRQTVVYRGVSSVWNGLGRFCHSFVTV